MTDDLLPEEDSVSDGIEIYRLDADGIIEMARGIVMGDRYFYPAAALQTGAPMWLYFTDLTQEAAANVGMVVGNMVERTDRAINGYPVTMGGWLVHADDTDAVLAKVKEYLHALGYDEAGEEE